MRDALKNIRQGLKELLMFTDRPGTDVYFALYDFMEVIEHI